MYMSKVVDLYCTSRIDDAYIILLPMIALKYFTVHENKSILFTCREGLIGQNWKVLNGVAVQIHTK